MLNAPIQNQIGPAPSELVEGPQEPLALYIKVENGQTVDHPVFPNNLMDVFGEIPSNYEPFIRLPESDRLPLGVFEVTDDTAPLYAKVNDVWTDVYARREMNAEERTAKEDEIRATHNRVIASFKETLVERIANSLDQDEVAFWQNLLDAYNNLVITDLLNPQFPVIPPFVKRDENGKVVSVNNAGSAPNVIG